MILRAGKPSVFAKLEIGRKKDKNVLMSVEKEKLTLIVIFYCSYCVYA